MKTFILGLWKYSFKIIIFFQISFSIFCDALTFIISLFFRWWYHSTDLTLRSVFHDEALKKHFFTSSPFCNVIFSNSKRRRSIYFIWLLHEKSFNWAYIHIYINTNIQREEKKIKEKNWEIWYESFEKGKKMIS